MKQLTILVVDDEFPIRDFFSKLITHLGHKVVLAEDGYAAVECVKKEPRLDLVFLDFKMPGIDGLETFKRIREANGKIHVVMMTGYAPDESLEKASQARLNGFVRKPMDLVEIKRIVDEAQGKRKEKKASILVIDDDPAILQFFQNLSKEIPSQIEVVSNGKQAIELLRRQRFNIVFLDVVLPPGEAGPVQEEISKLPPPLPDVVLISGFREELKEARNKVKFSISGIISKPFQVNDIVNQIELLTEEEA